MYSTTLTIHPSIVRSDILSNFNDIAPVRLLKHCTTHWLSLEHALTCLLVLWPALFAYFDRKSETGNERVQRITKKLASVETKLYASFVCYTLKSLNSFNVISDNIYQDWHHAVRRPQVAA